MALREIDRFAVRPAGVFANWRHKRVMIDENGNLSTDAVPGESETMNLPCISNYKKSNRRYANGALITEFCNLTTFTNFRIYAQDCEPFAYVQTDLNASKCGYQLPLPTPAIPPDPYANGNAPGGSTGGGSTGGTPTGGAGSGTTGGVPNLNNAAYGLFAYLDICDHKNIPINIRVKKRNYTGVAHKIKNGGAFPAIIGCKAKEENKFSPIRSSEFQLTLVSDPAWNAEQLYTTNEREFKIEVDKGGIAKFRGFGTAEEASEEFVADPYDITWRATDGLGALKNIAYPLPLGSRVDIQQKFIDILAYCLYKTDLALDIATTANLYEVKMLTGLNDDPLAQATVNPLRLTEKGTVLNCYKVLEGLCTLFGAKLVQDNGRWNFVRLNELTHAVLRRRVYNYTGLFLYAEQYNNKRVATCKGSDISMLDDKPMLRFGNAYKRVEVSVEHAELPLILYNGDFELWDGSNFTGWTKYGGIQVSRVENKIYTATGFVWSGNYALQFDQLAESGKYIEAGRVLVSAGDALSLSFNVGRTLGGINGFKLRVKLGNYYLANPAGDSTYIWATSLTTCTVPVNNATGNIDTYLVDLGLPEAPENGEIYIELFGFTQKVPGQYYPTAIDNIGVTRTSKTDATGRSLYLAEQSGFFTNKPDEIKLLFGDYAGTKVVVRPARAGGSMGLLNDYYAIRTKDGSYSTGWFEVGGRGSTTPLPIGLVLAKTILKAYQKPFRFLESSFFGTDISYLDIFNVNLPNDAAFNARIFTLLSGDFDLISGELKNAVYVEIFEKDIPVVTFSIPGKISSLFPPPVQNPNPEQPPVGGIFKAQFTNEFK